MTYSPGLRVPAASREAPPGRAIFLAANLRQEFGVGGDASFDAAISEAVVAAQVYATAQLGYSPVADERTDSYAGFGDGFRLGSDPDIEEELTIRYLDASGTVQDFAAVDAPLTDRAKNTLAYVDDSDYRFSLRLTPAGVSKAQAIGALDPTAPNPVTVSYEEAEPPGAPAIRIAIKKYALALFQQSPTEPATVAKMQMDEILDSYRQVIA